MSERRDTAQVLIEPWADKDLALLRLANAPEMMEHLGGPEPEDKVLARHRRYLDIEGAGTGRMFSVVLLPEGESVGTIGYWDRVWQGETVYETGWGVLPQFQGRGIAVAAATAAVADAAARQTHTSVHAFPSVDHPASNAICRTAGFSLVSECDFEYPAGTHLRCNDWRLDLTALG
ncbi:GNAT family N-acetyltransferase [Streptomyces sp. H10-C2]|uniref:GNAT family N-acetyltransferase n=1 Tax=unclassified Streptomyces TaxID=2593676 RepID=UPI0024B89C3B|nr:MULTISPECIES: GNAT family N-acetyltransferase [unclassified Streptomyces]MDJ0346233.1 GNAT family N-acetyltransferase [Streptomyces sp. PH10-H1]MDJ0371748.1 GNAT family N-acetyltransferase [Streptomyces sp. H10-C2]